MEMVGEERELVNRRTFIQSAGTWAAFSLLPGLAGCPVAQTTLESLAVMLAKAWVALAPFLKNVDPALSAKIAAEIAAVEAALNGWAPGKPITDIENVVNALVVTMNLIPVAAQFEPLVALIVATAEGILALVGGGANVMVSARGATFANPPRTARQFKKAWHKVIVEKALPAGLEIN
jgi:hypothetical protein